MCMASTPKIDAPEVAPERAATRTPDNEATSAAGRRQTDRLRAGSDTILTSSTGVTTAAPTAGKTLLGQ